jgi:hypothetical protein
MAIKDIGPLLGADEGLNHQIVDTFATLSQTDMAWTEKIWVSIARTDGSLQVDFGLGKYQNRGIIDGFGGVSRGKEQWTVRGAQRDWLVEDFENRIGAAVEEFIRWSSPVLQFARFATQDTEINGQPVHAGDKVGLFYCSANRDEAAFADPHVFDLQRSPNPHLGFGGGGPHFFLGNQLAKAELRNLFRELLTRLTRVEFSEPGLLYSNFVHGVKRLPAFVQWGES